jgi:spermidine synthase
VSRSRYLCIALVSAAALLFQVAQTRVFSATFGYHLTYLVISVALLGVGSGATLSALVDRRTRRPSVPLLALAAGASAIGALLFETHVDPVSLLAVSVLVAYAAGSLPFIFASWIVVRFLREDPVHAGRLYAADLTGAASGSVLAFFGLPLLGAPGLYGLSAVLAATAALAAGGPRFRLAASVAGAVAAMLALTIAGDAIASPQPGPDKTRIYGGVITHLATRWDPYARVDAVHYRNQESGILYRFLMATDYTGPRPDADVMYLDLNAATQVLDGSGDMQGLRAAIIAAPYELVTRPHVLVIGPGGGIDIQNALVHGATRVDAIEVNRGVSGLMRGQLADYSGHVYTAPGVTVYDDEARSFVRRARERYDLMVMTVVDSWAALANGSYALTESYLYTAEAFDDYLAHINEGGALAVGRWYREPPIEMLNTADLAIGALRRSGVADPQANIMVLRHSDFGLLLTRHHEFSATEVAAVRAFTQRYGFEITFDPSTRTGAFAEALATRNNVPATDDRPFFFSNSGDNAVPVAYMILFIALAPALALSYGLLLMPLRRVAGPALTSALGRRTTLQALMVGLGFIAAEIVLLQRLTLYLGQPALALALGLAALLVGAATGSAASARARLGVAGAALGCVLILVVALLALDHIAAATLSWTLPARALVACIASMAIGLPLGSVFPTVIALAGTQDEHLVSWAWAVNGAASVIGSIIAVGAALAIGFTAVGIAAATCYLVVALGSVPGVERLFRLRMAPA